MFLTQPPGPSDSLPAYRYGTVILGRSHRATYCMLQASRMLFTQISKLTPSPNLGLGAYSHPATATATATATPSHPSCPFFSKMAGLHSLLHYQLLSLLTGLSHNHQVQVLISPKTLNLCSGRQSPV